MDNQHKRIIGYRDLGQEDIDLMNAIKLAGKSFEALNKLVGERIAAQFAACNVYISAEEEHARDVAKEIADGKDESEVDMPSGMEKTPEAAVEFARLIAAEPHRWLAIARTDMQQALMALTRTIAQPSSF